ncbi:MAG: RNA polymerase sigma factor [Oscillospiraceae bacterium]|nr:RNA polymerase sigma factor [Oscillospiraceae bacterium]
MDNGESSYRRFLSGDDQGLVEIIRIYKDGLIFFLNGFTHDILAAEELCEDTFVKLAVNKPQFDGRSSFKTFLYTIARNTALDWKRTHKHHLSIDEAGEIDSGKRSLEEEYLREEQKIAVHRAMEKLKSNYRQVLWLTYFEELSNKETAAVMKKSVRSIETLVYRARNALKKQLEKEGFTYENI